MKNRRYMILIICVILILTGYGIKCLSDGALVHKRESNVLHTKYAHVPPREIEEKDDLFEFAISILEENLKGKVALIDPQLTAIEEDGYSKYFLKIQSIGIDNRHVIDLYHFYLILQKSEENEFYMTPFGLEVLVGEVDHVKENILISMLKLTNEWEINHIKN